MQKKDRIELNIFIDAFGWELYKENQWFLEALAAVKMPLKSVLGYSSACIPSIITGKAPCEHGYWSSFYYSPQNSPFRPLKHLGVLPKAVSDSARFRRYLSIILKALYGFSGYFELYSTPFEYLPYFDYQEKYDIFAGDDIGGCKTIFGMLKERKIPYLMEKEGPDEAKFEKANGAIKDAGVDFIYLSLGELDGLLHLNKKSSAAVKRKLAEYDKGIRTAYDNAKTHYTEVDITVFSDHGMKEVASGYDLIKDIESLNLVFGKDYAVFYDSTMTRFWFLKEAARKAVVDRLSRADCGRMLSDEELKTLGLYFEDRKYGELIFLMKPGLVINPSFMGRRPLGGMHGYHPDDADSYAIYLSSKKPVREIRTIMDIFDFGR